MSYGDVRSTHEKSVGLWQNLLSISSQKSGRVIFGCGGGENDRNLTEAFSRALFPVLMNVALSDSDSKICMLAECGSGLGSEAFLRFVTGRLEPRSKIGGVEYVDGLEVLLAFQKLQKDFELNILTTLPKYYASKFDLKTIGGAREAPASLVQPGSRAKILVLPDASSAYFKA
jgi:nickel-dependent lactate racemase